MNIMLETNPTISKEEVMSWIEAPYICRYNHCGSCHISQFEKENAEPKASIKDLCKDMDIMNNRESELLDLIENLKLENNNLKNFIQHNIVDNTNNFILSLSN